MTIKSITGWHSGECQHQGFFSITKNNERKKRKGKMKEKKYIKLRGVFSKKSWNPWPVKASTQAICCGFGLALRGFPQQIPHYCLAPRSYLPCLTNPGFFQAQWKPRPFSCVWNSVGEHLTYRDLWFPWLKIRIWILLKKYKQTGLIRC